MLRFLSKFNLATRIYAGFLFLGAYVVLVCFGAVFAVGYVHREYIKANNVIEGTRQLSALETYLFSLNRSLFFFASKGTDEEKQNVEDAFNTFEEKAKDVESYLELPQVRDKYKIVLSAALEKYCANMTEMFSLYEKSTEAAEKVNLFAEKASGQLNALIEETTLPSASFALNALREQLDTVLHSIDNASSENEESQKQLNADFAALKKAQNAARQAEMINTKQLKNVFASLNGLDDEINRKLKIDAALREKMQSVSQIGDQNSKDFKDLINLMAQSCAQLLSQAEAGKISLQKVFVFAAAFGGFLAVLMSFLSLFGIRYPLARLIENAQDMARGDRSVLIHFTEREDEVGALARALAVLLVRLKDIPVLTNETLLGRKNATYGASVAYVPLGAPGASGAADQENGGDEIAYFGQGVGVDTESQLCQMLSLVQHISNSAASMTDEIKKRFSACKDHLFALTEQLQTIGADTAEAREKTAEGSLSHLSEQVRSVSDSFSVCFSLADEMRDLLKKQTASADSAAEQLEQMRNFVSGLINWTQAAVELTDMIRSSSAETKILALNASIEAAKAGEKAKAFGAVSLDMRHRTHKTAEAAEHLSAHLSGVQKEAARFAETVKTAAAQVDTLRRSIQAFLPVQDNQVGHIQTVFGLAETAKTSMEKYIAENEIVRRILMALPGAVNRTEEVPPLLETQIVQAEQLLDSFNSSLPTYEEDKENGEV